MSTRRVSTKDPNLLRAIGPNLGDYTQWARLRAPTGRKIYRVKEINKKSSEAYRVVAIEKLQILLHGHGEVGHPIVGNIHGAVRRDGESVRGIRLVADMPSSGVGGPELGHGAHQNRRLLGWP